MRTPLRCALMPDLNDPADLPELRRMLRRAGIDSDELSDDEVRDAMRRLPEQAVPAPGIPAGSPLVSARAWLSDAMTSGGIRRPEDPTQETELEDGGPPIDLGILGILIMRQRSAAARVDR